jgi:biopolymer transport protein ExbD
VKIRTHLESFASLESIAITDIILNMFIFFFTAFSLVYTFNPSRESRISVRLPQADVRSPREQMDPIIITLNSRNEVFLNNRVSTLHQVEPELRSLISFNKGRPVIVRADKNVVFDRVVQVLEVTKRSGVERLGIAIEEKREVQTPKP